MSSLAERVTLSDLSVDGETPYFFMWIDYGQAFQQGADTFFADAYSDCPVDTGFLQSTIGASSDSEGFDCWADAHYASYVDDWSTFFTSAFNRALAVAEAVVDAIWWDALSEEYEMILEEMEEALAAIQEQIDNKDGEIEEKEEEKSELEQELEEAEEEEEEGEEGDEGGGEGFGGFVGGFLAMIIVEFIDALLEEITAAKEEKDSYETEYQETESYYNDILGFY